MQIETFIEHRLREDLEAVREARWRKSDPSLVMLPTGVIGLYDRVYRWVPHEDNEADMLLARMARRYRDHADYTYDWSVPGDCIDNIANLAKSMKEKEGA